MAQKQRQAPPRALIPVGRSPGGITLVTPAISARDSLLSKNTIRGYVRDWKDFFRVDDLKDISIAMCVNTQPEHVAAFRDELLAKEVSPGKPMSPGTIARKLTALRVLFDYLIRRELMVLNPAHPKLVRSPKRVNVMKMERLDHEEAKAFFSAIDHTTAVGRRDYALILMDLHMGLRRSEVLSIKADQFQVEGGVAYVVFRSKGQKDRKVTVNSDLTKALADYAKDRGNEPGWLFPGRDPEKPLSGDQFWKIVKRYLKAVGIKKRIGTHGLRATFITHNIEAGTPLSEIQKTVGHSRPETTLGYARDLELIKSRAPKAMEGFGMEKE